MKKGEMLKIVFSFLFFLLLIYSSFAYTVATGTKEQIRNVSFSGDITVFTERKAYVDNDKAYISQEPHTLRKGEEAKIILDAKQKRDSYTICFDFKGQEDNVTINEFKGKQFFGLLDKDLFDTKTLNDMVCMKSFTSDSEELTFSAEYHGMGKLKYDIYIPELNLTLDPYLIGDIEYSENLLYWSPMNTTPESDKITNLTKDFTISTAGGTPSWTFTGRGMDNNNATFAYRHDSISGGTNNNNFYYQWTLPGLIYMDDVGIKTAWEKESSSTTCNFQITLSSYDGSSWTQEAVLDSAGCEGGGVTIDYDSSYSLNKAVKGLRLNFTFTTLTGGSPENNFADVYNLGSEYMYSQGVIKSNYLLQGPNAVAGYLFDFGDSSDYFGSNDGADIDIVYTEDGAVCDGDSSYIDSPATDYQGYMSIHYRVKFRDSSERQVLAADTGATAQYLLEVLNSAPRLIQRNASAAVVVASSTILQNETWYDITTVKNETHATIYIDGVQDSTGILYGVQTSMSSALQICRLGFDNSRYLNGTMNKIQIYNKSLSLQEIIKLNNSGEYVPNVIGEADSAISFNGADEYVVVENDTVSVLNSPYTVSSWIYPRSYGGTYSTIYATGDTSYLVHRNKNNNHWRYQHLGLTPNTLTFNMNLSEWSHIVTIYNGSHTLLYQNGELVNSSAVTGTPTIEAYPLHIGTHPIYKDRYFNGSIDEFMLFNYALDEDEVQQLARGYNNSINITLRDTETGDLIDGEVDLEYYMLDGSFYVTSSTTTGRDWVNGFPSGDVRITATSSLYTTSTQVNDLSDINSEYYYTFYLSNKTGDNLGKLYVYVQDQDYYAIKGADTRLLQFFPDEGEYIEVEQCYSNSNGECVFNIILGTKRYIITSIATIDGQVVTAQSSTVGDFYPVDNSEIDLFLKYEPEFSLPDDWGLSVAVYNTSLVGNTSYLNAYFIDTNGNVNNTVCIRYDYVDHFTRTIVDTECTTGASGTINYAGGVLLDRNYTYYAVVYSRDADNNTLNIFNTFKYDRLEGFNTVFTDYLDIIIILLMAILLGFSIMIRNITVFPIGMIGFVMFYMFMKPEIFTGLVASVIIAWCVGILYLSRKQSDNEGT